MYKKLRNFITVPPGVTNLVSKCAGNLKEKSHKVSRRELCALQSNRAKCRGGPFRPPHSLFRVNPNRTGGGGGMESTPLDVSHDNFAKMFFRTTALSRLFSFESCTTFDAIFVQIRCTVPKLRNVERGLKILEFSGFVYKTYGKWLFVLKIYFGL